MVFWMMKKKKKQQQKKKKKKKKKENRKRLTDEHNQNTDASIYTLKMTFKTHAWQRVGHNR